MASLLQMRKEGDLKSVSRAAEEQVPRLSEGRGEAALHRLGYMLESSGTQAQN